MSLLVTGSIGIDDIQSPAGHVKGVYGGSAVYCSLAARLFTTVRLVGVVGEDFPPHFRDYLTRFGLDLTGLEVRKGSRTFKWSGVYDSITSDARTLTVELNVLAEAGPQIPPAFADTTDLFLAATHPRLQADMIGQIRSPRLIVADTRDLWINNEPQALNHTLSLVHGAILNDAETRLLTGLNNLVQAGRRILQQGPRFVVIKKGEHGSMLVTADQVAVLPAYPTTDVKDPTGAGDSFAGGMMGYLASRNDLGFETLRNALARGTIAASFTIEDFSTARIEKTTPADIDRRLKEYAAMLNVH